MIRFVSILLCTISACAQTLPQIDWNKQIKNKPETFPSDWYTMAHAPVYLSGQYDFAAQRPGTTLAIGSNIIPLDPVPAGLMLGASLYISGGTGTAEAAPITEIHSNSVTVTCANTHSGNWAIQSASNGIQEAIGAAGTNGGTIDVATFSTIHAAVIFPSSGEILIQGRGIGKMIVQRASDYLAGDLFYIDGGTCLVSFQNIWIDNLFGIASTGATIRTNNRATNTYVWSSALTSGQYGIRSTDGAGLNIYDSTITQSDLTFGAQASIAIEALTGTPISNVFISNVFFGGFDRAAANLVNRGIYLHNVDGVGIVNCYGIAKYAIDIQADDGSYSTNIWMVNPLVDAAGINALRIQATGSGLVRNIQVIGGHLSGASNTGTSGSNVLIGNLGVSENISRIRIVGADIALSYLNGIEVNGMASPAQLLIADCHIFDNGFNHPAAGISGINFSADITGVTIDDNQTYNTGEGSQQQGVGILDNVDFDGTITNNDFGVTGNSTYGNTNDAIGLFPGATFSGILGPNKGIDNTVGTLASASTVALGVASTYAVSGTTAIATINGGWAGRTVTFRFTNAAPGGLTASGNIYTAASVAQNATVTIRYDGTKWMVL